MTGACLTFLKAPHSGHLSSMAVMEVEEGAGRNGNCEATGRGGNDVCRQKIYICPKSNVTLSVQQVRKLSLLDS